MRRGQRGKTCTANVQHAVFLTALVFTVCPRHMDGLRGEKELTKSKFEVTSMCVVDDETTAIYQREYDILVYAT